MQRSHLSVKVGLLAVLLAGFWWGGRGVRAAQQELDALQGQPGPSEQAASSEQADPSEQAPPARGYESIWTVDQIPYDYDLTRQKMVWIGWDPQDPSRTHLESFDLDSEQTQRLHQGTFMRFVRVMSDGRLVIVEAGTPTNPKRGATIFPNSRILMHDGSQIQTMVESAPYCVEAYLHGDSVYWVGVTPNDVQRLPFMPSWEQAQLFRTQGGQTQRLTAVTARGGLWTGTLLGVIGDHLYLVERLGLRDEKSDHVRLLSVHTQTGERRVVFTQRGSGYWMMAEDQIFAVVDSPESQLFAIDRAVIRWTPDMEGEPELLTDWLPPPGRNPLEARLVLGRGKLYYAVLNMVWEVPLKLGLSHRRIKNSILPLRIVSDGKGVWVVGSKYGPVTPTVEGGRTEGVNGLRLIRRRF